MFGEIVWKDRGVACPLKFADVDTMGFPKAAISCLQNECLMSRMATEALA